MTLEKIGKKWYILYRGEYMNYCSKCKNKIGKNDKFCTKCGAKIKREADFQKPLLILGIFLVLFATFALGIFSWENMSKILRICFFGFECILFFGLSFVLKQVGSKINRLFFVIGLVLIPYTLSLFAYYNIIPSFLSSGAGINVYLAIIYFITFLIYLIVNIKFNSVFVDVLTVFALLISFINIGLAYKSSVSLVSLIVIVYSVLIYLLSFIGGLRNNLKLIFKIFSIILLVLVLPVYIFALFIEEYKIINLISIILYVLISYIIAIKEKNDLFKVLVPIGLFISINSYLLITFEENEYVYYIMSFASILVFILSCFFKSKAFRVLTLVFTYLSLLMLLSASTYSYNIKLTTIILSGLILLLNIVNILFNKYKGLHYLLPFTLYVFVYYTIKYFINIPNNYIINIVSTIYLIVYIILKSLNSKHSNKYILGSMILSLFSYPVIYNHYDIDIIPSLILFTVFTLSILFDEHRALTILSYIFFNFELLSTFSTLDNAPYYSLLAISGFTLVFGLLFKNRIKFNFKPFMLYAEIIVILITLFNPMSFNAIILLLGILVYALGYISVIKNHNKLFYRLFYIMLGLITLTRVISLIIEPVVIASIISIAAILIILTVMYLLEVESNWGLTLISLVILLPYYRLIGYFSLNYHELYLLPLIIYTIVLTEIYKFKDEENRKVFTIIPLSLLALLFININSGILSIAVDLLIGLLYIALGLYRKYSYFIYFGIIFIVVTILIQLFTIIDSIAIVILLIIIGFILIGIALYNEFKKKE